MLSQLTSYVPVFDGNNWNLWSSAMHAYLMAQGKGPLIVSGAHEPDVNTAPAALADDANATAINAFNEENHIIVMQTSARNEWRKLNDMMLGNIMLCLSPALQQMLRSYNNAANLWDQLKSMFRKMTLPSVYKDFKEAISIQFNPNQHPAAQFDKLAAAFGCLANVTVGTEDTEHTLALSTELQALVALATLPPKWETLVAVITQNYDLGDILLGAVHESVCAQYKTKTNRGQHKGAQNANKISAIKCKCGNPDFHKQENQQQRQQPSSSSSKQSGNQQQQKQRSARGSGKSKKDKGKQPAHSHVASIATLPPPTSHTIVHIGSSSMTQCIVSEPTPPTRTPGPYSLLNKALTLAERLEVKPTIQTVKTLEQHFAEFDETVRTHPNYNMDEESDSDIDVDMSQPGPSCINM